MQLDAAQDDQSVGIKIWGHPNIRRPKGRKTPNPNPAEEAAHRLGDYGQDILWFLLMNNIIRNGEVLFPYLVLCLFEPFRKDWLIIGKNCQFYYIK